MGGRCVTFTLSFGKVFIFINLSSCSWSQWTCLGSWSYSDQMLWLLILVSTKPKQVRQKGRDAREQKTLVPAAGEEVVGVICKAMPSFNKRSVGFYSVQREDRLTQQSTLIQSRLNLRSTLQSMLRLRSQFRKDREQAAMLLKHLITLPKKGLTPAKGKDTLSMC